MMTNQNQRVLIVDDTLSIHEDFRKILAPVSSTSSSLLDLERKLLSRSDMPKIKENSAYDIDFASQGLEAVEKVRTSVEKQRPYAIAFVDCRMPPGMDGVETIGAIWKIDPNINVVFCTAYSDYGWLEIIKSLGRTDKLLILKKPFDHLELLQITLALTEKWRLERLAQERFKELEIESSDYFKQMVQAQKMEAVGRLASGVAHDFNNLLTINFGYASLLLTNENLSEKARFYVGAMKEATERSAGLTRQLLAFSRQENTPPSNLNVKTLIEDMHGLLAQAAGEEITLEFDVKPDVKNIGIDKTHFEQILMNLVINARDAMSEHGRVLITARNISQQDLPFVDKVPDSQDYVLMQVKDNGHGMSEEIQNKIFEPFFTTKAADRGTGLGLSTVFGIIQKLKGFIWVDSEVGVGTQFSLAFPVESTQNTTVNDPAFNSPNRQKQIMVVDDELEIREMVVKMLEKAGFKAFGAAGSVEASNCLSDPQASIDLVLTDIVMPKVTGIQMADLLKQEHPSLPIVFMSAYPKDRYFQQDVALGKRQFLQKPFTKEALINTLSEALEKQA
jgi:signal transduction histidine kinase